MSFRSRRESSSEQARGVRQHRELSRGVPTHLAFLRAVNLGRIGKIAMADLRAWLMKLGFVNAQTLLQSGNLVFRGGSLTGVALEQHLEREAGKRLGLQTDFFVRTVKEWEEVIAHNPFREAAKNDASHLVVAVLKSAPTASQLKALETAIKGSERVRAYGRHAYIVYPDGIGTSKLTLSVIEKHLGTRGTCRNWNTTLKMAALAFA
jgi:uncharacterized protein (DUF1697 family)